LTGCERAARIVEIARLGSPHLRFRLRRYHRETHPRRQSAAARHDDRIEGVSAEALERFERDRRLSRDHMMMIARRHDRILPFARELRRDFLAALTLAVVSDDARARLARLFHPVSRRIRRHLDSGRNIEHAPDRGDSLTGIARRIRDDAIGTGAAVEPRRTVICAAKLERARMLKRFELDEHFRAVISSSRSERTTGVSTATPRSRADASSTSRTVGVVNDSMFESSEIMRPAADTTGRVA
jgi:hypothetical protein